MRKLATPNKSMTLSCTPSAYAIAMKAAKAEGRSLCNFIRAAVLQRAKDTLNAQK